MSHANVESGGLYVGVDGCKGGWLCFAIDLDNYETGFRILADFSEVIVEFKCAEAIAVDIPIGLPENGARTCDREARRMLGRPRGASVFPAPIRPILRAAKYEKACQISRRIAGKKVSKQAFGILAKVREVDQVVSPGLQNWIHEVHPELCFWAMNGGRPMQFSKRSEEGRRERLKLLSKTYPQIRADLAKLKKAAAGVDDLLDAAAAAWSAVRIGRQEAARLPEAAEADPTGLRMEISY